MVELKTLKDTLITKIPTVARDCPIGKSDWDQEKECLLPSDAFTGELPLP